MARPIYVWGAVFLAILALGAYFRTTSLTSRPMHADEANQAHKTGVLLEEGVYRYDPVEHHGPTLYYFTLPILWASGVDTFAETSAAHFRTVPALFGIALLALLWCYGVPLGRGAAVAALLLAALSPALVYYSRYYIQEILLVFFTYSAVITGWGYAVTHRLAWAVTCGLCIGLMHATKESCAIVLAAMAGALILTGLWARWREGIQLRDAPLPFGKHLLWAVSAAVLVSALLFSSFLTHPQGPLDSIRTYFHYVQRAGDADSHIQPWYYYLKTLIYVQERRAPVWSEAFILAMALIGSVAIVRRSASSNPAVHFQRFMLCFAWLLVLAFSVIPYKTPWNMLVFLFGLTILGGVGIGAVLRGLHRPVWQAMLLALLAPFVIHLGVQAHRSIGEYAAAPSNPYAYGHTTSRIERLMTRVEQIASVAPEGRKILIRVIVPNGDYWPLPWYLRTYPNTGYWSGLPDEPPLEADILIAAPELQGTIADHLDTPYFRELQPFRPGVLLAVFIREDLWEAFMETRR